MKIMLLSFVGLTALFALVATVYGWFLVGAQGGGFGLPMIFLVPIIVIADWFILRSQGYLK